MTLSLLKGCIHTHTIRGSSRISSFVMMIVVVKSVIRMLYLQTRRMDMGMDIRNPHHAVPCALILFVSKIWRMRNAVEIYALG